MTFQGLTIEIVDLMGTDKKRRIKNNNNKNCTEYPKVT